MRRFCSTQGELDGQPGADAHLDVLDDIGRVNRTACERIVELVRSLENRSPVARKPERGGSDIHEGIESALTLVHHELKNRVEVMRDYGELPPVECFPSHLNQVFMNLLVNASQAIEDKGRHSYYGPGDDGEQFGSRSRIPDDGIGIPREPRQSVRARVHHERRSGRAPGSGFRYLQ